MQLIRILIIAILSLYNISQINAQVEIKRQLILPEKWKCDEDEVSYKIKIDLNNIRFIKSLNKPENIVYICFPKNGQQPGSKDIAKYSCSYIDSIKITNWYIWAFGGDVALRESSGIPRADFKGDFPPDIPRADFRGDFSMGGFFLNPFSETSKLTAVHTRRNVISIFSEGKDIETLTNNRRAFWKTFRKVAENPVGRILLYRILIELNRIIKKEGTDSTKKYNYIENGSGVIEAKIARIGLGDINARNNCRSIDVNIISDASKSNFSWLNHTIAWGKDAIELPVLEQTENSVKTSMQLSSSDIVLFHEMLHWFHFLRDPVRYKKDKTDMLNYLVLSYYGDVRELLVWGSVPELEVEEMKTILGTPDLNKEKQLICKDALQNRDFENKKFQEGDDLSENAYRISNHSAIRFGHTDMLISEFDPSKRQNFSKRRFQLAQESAKLTADIAKSKPD